MVSVLDAVRDCAGYLVGDERMNEIAEWMMKHGYATGHGDTVVDLLTELEWQVAEKEREACAKLCESMSTQIHGYDKHGYAEEIRARGEL
jgi:hypothetical protein